MELKTIYNSFGGDYEDVLGRLLTEERIAKYLRKFALNEDFDLFNKAVEEKNYEDAFRYSHNLKGVSLNLGFSRLAASASALCEYFRNGVPTDDFAEALKQVEIDRNQILESIKEV